MSFADSLGWGTDPEGDAARREAMASAVITPEMVAAIRAGEDRELRRALGHDRPSTPDEVDPDPVPGHHLTHRRGGAGTEVVCECGRWGGWYNGARSRRRVLDDHAAHAAAEHAAEGPIKVVAVRLDQPEELEP